MSLEHDPTNLSQQARNREEQDRAAYVQRELEKDDLRWLMGDKRGRRIMWRLLEAAGVHRLSYSGEATHDTAFREGCRNVGNVFLSDVFDTCPNHYNLMRNERRALMKQANAKESAG